MISDIRHALRSLRKHPGFTAAAVGTLAIGLGATTTIFSAVNAVLLRPIPVADPRALLSVTERLAEGGERGSLSLPEYRAYRDDMGGVMDLAVHHVSDVILDTEAFAAALRAEIRTLDPDVAPVVIAPLQNVLESSLFPQRLAAGLIGGLGTLGLVLAAVGVFGVLSFRVVQRRREIGVRVALGASGSRVIGIVVRDALRLLAIGLALGFVGALLSARLLAGLLHGLSPADPATYVGVAALLSASVAVAAYLPARRAARVDPMEALRSE